MVRGGGRAPATVPDVGRKRRLALIKMTRVRKQGMQEQEGAVASLCAAVPHEAETCFSSKSDNLKITGSFLLIPCKVKFPLPSLSFVPSSRVLKGGVRLG